MHGELRKEVMTIDYQRVILLGNTTDQAEVRQAKNGSDYALFGVAVGKGKEETVFFPVTLFGESAKLAGEMLTKGTRVLVEGSLDVDPETGKFRVRANTFYKA